MKTLIIAVLFFIVSFAGVFSYGWYKAPSPNEAAAEGPVKDAIVAELGEPPAPAPANAEPAALAEAYRALDVAYRKMNATCTADARKAYAVAFAAYIEANERDEAEGSGHGPDVDRMATMNQFLDAAGRGVIVASDMPNRRFRRMVATLAQAPRIPQDKLPLNLLYNDAGEPMEPSRCKPLEG